MIRFFVQAVPLIVLMLLLFSIMAGTIDLGPAGAMTILDWRRVSIRLLLGTWLFEAFGLVALFLLISGRSRNWWLDGLMVGWIAWIFRGPLLVVTITVAAGATQTPWFKLTIGWWVLYSVCGLALAILAKRLEVIAAHQFETGITHDASLETKAMKREIDESSADCSEDFQNNTTFSEDR